MSINNDTYRLWQHNNGTWYIVWSGLSDTGKQSAGSRRISARTTDRREAEKFRAQFIEGLKRPAAVIEPTLGELLTQYRDEHAIKTRSLVTIDHNIKSLKPFFGDLLPSHLTAKLLIEYAQKRGASDGTILRELGSLKAAVSYAESNHIIDLQPDMIMPVRRPAARDIWFTREEVQKLIENTKSPHIKLFIKIAVSTAARSGAILDLLWPQANLDQRMIDFGKGFGNKRRSVVPMNDEVYEALREAQQLAQTDHVIEYQSKPVKSIKKAFFRLCRDNGIKGSPHILRHTAATWLISDGVPLAEVARLLGDSEKTVETVYGKHAPNYLRRAVNALNLNSPKA